MLTPETRLLVPVRFRLYSALSGLDSFSSLAPVDGHRAAHGGDERLYA